MNERNDALLRKVGDYIAAEPHRYRQGEWYDEDECGTTACVAGWTVVLHDGDVPRTECGTPYDPGIDRYAQEYLGIDDETAEELFNPCWRPAGYRHNHSHARDAELVRDALYRLADGASIGEVSV